MSEVQTKPNDSKVFSAPVMFFLLAGIIGALFAVLNYDSVFPSASIDLKLNQEQIRQRAQDFSRSFGYDPDGAVESTVFDLDFEAKTFLEYEMGLAQANRLMRQDIPVYSWVNRFCREHQVEEIRIWLNPDGRLQALSHDIEKEKALPELSHEAALVLAREFASKQALVPFLQGPQSGAKLIKDGTIKQPKRIDHFFSWKDETTDYKGGKRECFVYVSGDRVTEFSYYLHVPEKFSTRFNHQRSYNRLLYQVASVPYILLSAALIFAFIYGVSTKLIRWRLTLLCAGAAALMTIPDQLNYYPLLVSSYETTKTIHGFIGDEALRLLRMVLMAFLVSSVSIGAGELFYRRAFPQRLSLEKLLSNRAMRTREFLQGLLVGHALCGVHLAWVSLFYMIGPKLGIWSPLEVRESTLLSTVFPQLSAFNVGVSASVTEEILYRVICLFLVQKLTGRFWLANLFQAVAWAFMHSTYPQEPFWARGLELSMVGLAYGAVIRYFGLIPCICSHFIYDAFLGVTPVLSSSSGWMVALAYLTFSPLLIFLGYAVFKAGRQGLETDRDGIENKDIGNGVVNRASPGADGERLPYSPLSKRTKIGLSVGAILLALISLAVPERGILSGFKMQSTKEQITAIARRYLQQRGVPLEGYRVASRLTADYDSESLQYVYEKEGLQATDETARRAVRPVVWTVRFFKPKQRRQYRVYVCADGRPLSISVFDEEDAKGARLEESEIRSKVESYLRAERPEFGGFKFESSQKVDRKNRRDYTLTYEVPDLRVAEARYKVSINTVGNELSDTTAFWDLPRAWTFERSKRTSLQHVAGYVSGGISLAISLAILYWAFNLMRSQSINWRGSISLAMLMCFFSLIGNLNLLPTLDLGYDTDLDYSTFLASRFIGDATGLLGLAAGGALGGAFVLAVLKYTMPNFSLKATLRSVLNSKGEEDWYFRAGLLTDGLICAAFGCALFAVLEKVYGLACAQFSPQVPFSSLSGMNALAVQLSPSLDALCTGINSGISTLISAVVAYGLFKKFFRRLSVLLVFITIVTIAAFLGTRYWQDFVLSLGLFLATTCLSYLYVRYLARQNFMAYFFFGYYLAMLNTLDKILRFGPNIFAVDIALITAFLLLPFLLYFRRTKKLAVLGESA